MSISNFINRLFSKEEVSKNVAKERLRLVLVHDRLDLSEQVMNSLREELIAVIGKYMIIDEPLLEVSVSREDEGVALVANIPIVQVRRQFEIDNNSLDEKTPAEKADDSPNAETIAKKTVKKTAPKEAADK